jgi:histidinol-phosphate aminotransferase
LKKVKEESTMSLSRRRFVQTVGAGAAGLYIAGRGREAGLFDLMEPASAADAPIILASNENPLGTPKTVLNAVRGGFGEIGRYQTASVNQVTEQLARAHGVKPENVLLGSGSTQILRTTTHVFCSKTAPLVAPIPAYEECAGYAALMGYPVRTVSLTPPPELKMNIGPMLDAAKGGGMVFFCNPNNPVATAVDGKTARQFVADLNRTSPNTYVLMDEAYFEYATMPGYETMIELAVENPKVVVARTFSKCYGMAGLRIGYAIGHRDTIKKLAAWDGTGSINVLGLTAAAAALNLPKSFLAEEKARNNAAREFTQKWFRERGFTPTDSQTNFMFVDIKRPARGFRDACAKEGILVGRDFPPYEKTHCRISVGTMEEMQKAVKVFEQALAAPAVAA